MSLEKVLAKKTQELTDILCRASETITDVTTDFKEKSSLLKTKLSHKALFITYAPLDTALDKKLSDLLSKLKEQEKKLEQLTKESEESINNDEDAHLSAIQARLSSVDELADKIYSLRDDINANFAAIEKEEQRLEKTKINIEQRIDNLIEKARLANYPTDLFTDERFSTYPARLKQISAQALVIRKQLKQQTTELIKTGLKPHQLIQAMLLAACDIYSEQENAVSALEKELDESSNLLVTTNEELLSLKSAYKALAKTLLKKMRIKRCQEPPYSNFPAIQHYLEISTVLQANIEECTTVQQAALDTIKIDGNWITNITDSIKDGTRRLKNIEEVIHREYEKAAAEIRRAKAVIDGNRDEISTLYEECIRSLTAKIDSVEHYLQILNDSGINITLETVKTLKERYINFKEEAEKYIAAKTLIKDYSHNTLYHHKEKLMEPISRGHRVLSEAFDTLLADAKALMKREKQRFNTKIEHIDEHLEELSHFTQQNYQARCFLEPGHYQHQGEDFSLGEGDAFTYFGLPESLRDAIKAQRFDTIDEHGFAPPLAARSSTITTALHEHNLTDYERKLFLLNESVRIRRQSSEVTLIAELNLKMDELKTTLQVQNIGHEPSDIQLAIRTIEAIKEKLDEKNQSYINLHTPNSRELLRQVKAVIEDSIIHGDIEHLSDGIKPYAIQWIRINMLRPVINWCRKHLGWFEDRLTFFASSNEHKFMQCGIEARRQITLAENQHDRDVTLSA